MPEPTLARAQQVITAADEWLDSAVADTYQDQPLAQDWARVAKLAEEAGEAVDALIAFTGQNPRKGVCGTQGDLLAELADTACCGLFAIQHFTKDVETTWEVFSAALEKMAKRAGIPDPQVEGEPSPERAHPASPGSHTAPGESSPVQPGTEGEKRGTSVFSASPRERLGRLVREIWVDWAVRQPGAKPSWLTPWASLDDGQREVDMRIGEAVATDAVAAERERWRAVLADHYLMGINCDHETKRDNPMCACSRIHLGWHPSIGAARDAWIDHVTAVLADSP